MSAGPAPGRACGRTRLPRRPGPGLGGPVLLAVAALALVWIAPWGAPGVPDLAAARTPEAAPATRSRAPEEAPPVPAAQEEAPQVPAARLRLDRRIEEELSAVLRRIPGLEEVRARVEAGVVVLEGNVLSPEDRALAEALAAGMGEVVYVENRVDTTTSLGSRLGAALAGARGRMLDFVAYLPLLAVALLIVVAFVLLARWAGSWQALYERATPNTFAQNILRQGVRAGVFLVGVLLALQLLEVTALVGAVLGAAGIFGLAVGFAFRAIAENYLAGVFLSLRQPFAPNDHVVMDGHEGKVVRLSARETVLMTLEGNHLRLPNATVFGAAILNYTRNPRRRFEFVVSVGEEEDLARAQEEGKAVLDGMEGVLDEPGPAARVANLGDGVVVLRFFGWVDQREHDFGKVRSEAIRLVKAGLDAAGIAMPPTAYLLQMAGAAEAAMPAEPRPEPRPAAPGPAPADARPGDISVDRTIDEQIEEDRRASREENLLDAAEPPGRTA